jgi:hypothetical protein
MFSLSRNDLKDFVRKKLLFASGWNFFMHHQNEKSDSSSFAELGSLVRIND